VKYSLNLKLVRAMTDILKLSVNYIAPHLSTIMNNSFITGYVAYLTIPK